MVPYYKHAFRPIVRGQPEGKAPPGIPKNYSVPPFLETASNQGSFLYISVRIICWNSTHSCNLMHLDTTEGYQAAQLIGTRHAQTNCAPKQNHGGYRPACIAPRSKLISRDLLDSRSIFFKIHKTTTLKGLKT